MKRSLFFKPKDGWVGDVIPYEENGRFYLFYLLCDRKNPQLGTPWNLVTTCDVTSFTDEGVSLPAGSTKSPDFNAYTGSLIKDFEGTHHLFYTGQNPNRKGQNGRPLQVVLKAISHDGMKTWEKRNDFLIEPPEALDTSDWRDPFVFYDQEAEIWRMLVAARTTQGPSRRRGLIAQLVSEDLETWVHTEPFWKPEREIAHECPEVFHWGDWWYLAYSEFSSSFCTRYRMAKKLSGPWVRPKYDTVDSRAFYAAKSAAHNGRRFFFGWIATRESDHDDGAWQWAGTMSMCEAVQRSDGTLAFRIIPEQISQFTCAVPISWNHTHGGKLHPFYGKSIDLYNPDGHSTIITNEKLPSQCLITVDFELIDACEFGVLIRCSEDGEQGYEIRIEPRRQRMVFDRWPRKTTGSEQWQISGDVPYLVELERPCDIQPGMHKLQVVLEDTLCVANLDDSVMLSTRIYDHITGNLGLFADDGNIHVSNVEVLCQPGFKEFFTKNQLRK